MSEISVTIVGNITRKPEIKTTNTGKLVTRLRVASTRKRYVDERWVDGESAYIDVDCWGHLAQNAVNTFGKGDRVIAEGRLRTDEWQDEHGTKKSFTKVVADSVGPELRFATAVIQRTKTAGGRVAESERRAREAAELGAGGNGVGGTGGVGDGGAANGAGGNGGGVAADGGPNGAQDGGHDGGHGAGEAPGDEAHAFFPDEARAPELGEAAMAS